MKSPDLKHNYFENIDSESKAYWLGYLIADGYNYQVKNRVQFSQSETDKESVFALQDELCHNGKITVSKDKRKNSQDMYMLSICSKKISDDLAKLQCYQGKSLTCDIPKIKKHLLNHFVRGYFDGDGCIYFKIREKDNALVIECPIVCSNLFSKSLSLELDKLGVKHYSQKLGKNKLCTTLKVTGRTNNLIFLSWLYKNSSISLKRKKDKVDDFFFYCKSHPPKKQRKPTPQTR